MLYQLVNSFTQMAAPFQVAILTVAIVFGTGIVMSMAKQIRKFACQRQELTFKREMVERGMSVGDIERLVAARSSHAGDDA